MPARAQHPGDLGRRRAAVELGDEVEEVVGVGQGARLAHLEGDPPLGVEPDPRVAARTSAAEGSTPRTRAARELAGEEERRVALAAVDHQRALGRRHVEHRGGKRGERRGAHGADHRKPEPRRAIL